MNIRILKAIVVSSIALFYSLIAFNNLTDFEYNKIFIQKVMSLHSIQNDTVAWRAITNSHIQLTVYWMFILWELLIAVICWTAAVGMVMHRDSRFESFLRYRSGAVLGMTMGFLLFMVGFVDIGTEWFYLFQSEFRETQSKAIQFSTLMMGGIMFVASNSNEAFPL